MNIEEYKQKIILYNQFAEVVRSILSKESDAHNIKLHHTFSRAKEYESLEEKIKKEKYSKKNHNQIED